MITEQEVRDQLGKCFTEAQFPEWQDCYSQGKVRDIYVPSGLAHRILITTDRQSALDKVLGAIPFKGQTINRVAQFWFDQTADIVGNHIVAVPHPNVMVVEELGMIPIEIVVRDYLTGSSGTAIWTHYKKGVRNFYGHILLPYGLKKNTPLEHTIVTPTTKLEPTDRNLCEAEIIGRDMASPEQWEEMRQMALTLFARGKKIAAKLGLILVDTKYEAGYDPATGKIKIADELHTPESSRYWIAETYEERLARGEEPQSLDKEFLRLYLEEHGYTAANLPPSLPDDVRVGVALRYIELCERVTGQPFEPIIDDDPLAAIQASIAPYMVTPDA